MNKINKKFTIIKKIAKHGNQAIIVIPRMLEQHLKPGTMVQLGIDVIDDIDGRKE
jgi:antitoxin component of MazEF toxin-antitoxin module